MSKLTLKLENSAKINRAMAQAPQELAKAMQEALEQAGVYGVRQVKLHITSGTSMWKAPVDTGALRRGIQVTERTPLRVVIEPSSSTPYASYVHDGTSRMPARPFFEITKQLEEKNIMDFFKKRLDRFAEDLANKIGK